MGRWINADAVVHWQSYDDETESYPEHTGTIADLLDQMTDEGCPERVDAVPVQRCGGCRYADWHSNGCIAYCTKHGTDGHVDDGFCSEGEKDGDGND